MSREKWWFWTIGCGGALASARLALPVLIAAALVALVAADAGARVPATALQDDWVEVRTRNFTVIATSSGDAADVARRLERLREVMVATHPTLDAAVPAVVRVYAFGGEGPLRAYGPRGVEHAAGFNVAAEGGDLIAFDAGFAESDRNRVLQHEYVHSIVRHNLVRIPAWLNEGLAEYYSTFATRGSTADVGRPVAERLQWLAGHHLMPLERLFAITRDSPEYRGGSERGTFYAESWALVHYLSQSSPQRADAFQRFVSRLKRGHPPLEAFAEVATRDRWPELLHELDAYCSRPEFAYVSYKFATPFASVPQQGRVPTRAEVLCRLGDLAAQNDDPDARLAEEHFRSALAADSLHAVAMASLGWLLDRRGDTIHAESLYTAAAEVAPRDARIWTLGARGALRRLEHGRAPASSSVALDIIRVRFARALQLDPDNLEALVGYGTTYRNELAPPASAASALAAASRWLPARVDVACDLALVWARMDRCAEADSVFRERIEPLGEEPVVESVRRAVAGCGRASTPARPAFGTAGLPASESFAAYQVGLRAANQQRYDEAIRQLERADSLEGSGEFRDRIRETLASVRARGQLTRCIGLINAGELAQAKRLLDEIAGVPMDDSTRAYVARLRKRTDTRIALQRGAGSAARGDLEAAGGVLDSVLASRADDDLKTYARALGNQVQAHRDIEQAMSLLRAGRLEEARARFVAMKQTRLTAAERDVVEALMRHVDARLAIDRALTLIRAGDVAGARTLLKGVMEAPVGKNLHAYAEGLLHQLDANRPR